MRFDIITIFPGFFDSPLKAGLLGQALSGGVIEVYTHDPRIHAPPPHHKTDDYPYGGGAGLVMTAPPLLATLRELPEISPRRVIYLSPAGRPLDEALVRSLANLSQIVLLCGRYEGVDQRVIDIACDMEVSIGDYVLSGGEAAALVLLDAVARRRPGFMGNAMSTETESFSEGLLEYPQYTRPPEVEGRRVPEILLSGHHGNVAEWRRTQALRRTFERRPELLARVSLSPRERKLIDRWAVEKRENSASEPPLAAAATSFCRHEESDDNVTGRE